MKNLLKTVLITGGARRIGKVLSTRFAECGFNVLINYNKSKNQAEELQNSLSEQYPKLQIKTYQADVSDFSQVEEMFLSIDKDSLIPNILVNNAGVFPQSTKFEDLQQYLWHTTLDTNLSSQYYCSQSFLKLIKKYNQEHSRIINIASLGGLEVWKDRTSYNVSKAGVLQLTKSLARDLAPLVSVNSVSPGTIEIPNDNPSEELRISEQKTPFGRYGTADDVFDAVYFFATCSPYITGNNLNIDGAYHLSR